MVELQTKQLSILLENKIKCPSSIATNEWTKLAKDQHTRNVSMLGFWKETHNFDNNYIHCELKATWGWRKKWQETVDTPTNQSADQRQINEIRQRLRVLQKRYKRTAMFSILKQHRKAASHKYHKQRTLGVKWK